jgi:hypothetical protein
MGYLRHNAHIASGNVTGVGPGGQAQGNAVFIGQSFKKVDHLSAIVTVDAETDTLTLAGRWQVSNDASTWLTIAHAPQNPAAVVLATGTTGADAAVTKILPAPAAVYGYKFARSTLVVGGTTGTTNDTYSIAYAYRSMDPQEAQDGHLRFAAHIASGNATGVVAGDQVNGATLFVGGADPKVSHLSALVTVDAETNTLTMTGKWQASNDGSTWVDVAHAPQNPAGVALATGTAGADADVVRVLPAPDAVYGYKFARCSVVVGVVTGTTNDTYSIGYSYRQLDPGGGADW